MTNKPDTDTDRRGRGDAKLRALPPEQRQQVDQWLFEQQLPYALVVEKCKKELRLDLTIPSVHRYRHTERHCWELRQQTRAAVQAMQERWPTISEPEAHYRALLTKVSQFVLGRAHDLEKKENRALVAEYTRIVIAARREASIAHRGALAREKFEFDAATACPKHQIEIQAIMQNQELNDGDRVDQIRRELFGENLPK